MAFIYNQLFVTPSLPTESFAGQTVIVTGSNVGLGREAARHIARLGASKIILAVRNLDAGETARKDIIATTKCDSKVLEVWKLDLSSSESVKAFAKRAESELDRIDVLLENAGIATEDFAISEGHERTVTVNVIMTFLLALLLLPKLERSAKQFNIKPRISIVSSEVHAWTKFPEWKSEKGIFSALDDPQTKTMGERYPTSKLLEILAIREIAPKMKESRVIVNCLNPGFCHSELARENKAMMLTVMKAVLARSTEVGSRTLVAAASADSASHGRYMSNGVVADEALSGFVSSSDGAEASKKVWAELRDILEGLQSGVTQGF